MLASYPFAGVALARLVVICLVAYFRSVRWLIDCWQAILGSFELEETSQRKERERDQSWPNARECAAVVAV